MNLSDQIVSIIRTVVPAIVGAVAVKVGMELGVDIDGATAGAFAATLCTSLYYAAARQLEARWPAAGILLGVKRTPTY